MLHCRVRLNNIGTNIMAISSGYYGLRKGSTKSHTYSVLNGKQITKDRVEGGKNPRSYAQMVQRCMVGTIGSAYSAMKTICDHSFEGKSAGLQCMREFNSRNLMLLRTSQGYNNGFFENQRSGSKIPRRKKVLEVKFTTAHSQITEFGSSCSEPTDIVTLHEYIPDNVGTYLSIFLVIDSQGRTHDTV